MIVSRRRDLALTDINSYPFHKLGHIKGNMHNKNDKNLKDAIYIIDLAAGIFFQPHFSFSSASVYYLILEIQNFKKNLSGQIYDKHHIYGVYSL